jgi:uncharacterized protein
MSLVQAAWQGHLDEVKRLIDSKANPNEVEDHQTPLQAAVQNNQSEVVFWLLNRCRKVDVNQQDEQGWTPLLSAAVDGRYTICRALLSLKALKVGIFNSEQNGSLIYLCKRPPSLEDREIYEEILGLLLQRGIDLNHRNRFGEAAVHYAAMNNNHLALRFLYDNRCNVNAINKYVLLTAGAAQLTNQCDTVEGRLLCTTPSLHVPKQTLSCYSFDKEPTQRLCLTLESP